MFGGVQSVSIGQEERAESGGGHTGDSPEGACEVALIGEASAKTDFGERSVRREHALARCADAQAMDVLADAFADATAKNAGDVDRMDTGFTGEFIQSEPTAMLGLEFVQNA